MSSPEPDFGLYGPGSATWRVHGDPIMWVAGVRALFLQALHPLAMRGVAQNSDFRDDPWGRLMRTAAYVATTAYGTNAQAVRAGERVRAIHRRLSVTDPETGAVHPVDAPRLLLWVHCAQMDSFASTGLRVGLIDLAEADRYLAEQRRTAELVGLDAGAVPGSMGELADYLAGVRPELRLTPEARETARFLLLPRPAQVWLRPLRPAWLPVGSLAFGALPGWARQLYGGPSRPGPETVTALLRAARRAALVLPPAARTRPEIRSAQRRARQYRRAAGAVSG